MKKKDREAWEISKLYGQYVKDVTGADEEIRKKLREKQKRPYKKTRRRTRKPPPFTRVVKVKHAEVPREIPDGILEKVQREQDARRGRILQWRREGKAASIIEAEAWYLAHPELDP